VPESFIRVERRPDQVAVITLDRPKANALSVGLLAELEAVLGALGEDQPGAVVVTGSPRIFAAGADISEFGGAHEAAVFGAQLRSTFDRLAAFPRPVIAAVCGYALGGGCELALACDLRVAADTATFGQPEILLGLIPGAGGTQRLTRLVGPARAKDLVFTGRQIGSEEAYRIGLVDRVAPAAETLETAVALAADLARGPYLALHAAKQAIDQGLDQTLHEGLDLETRLFVDLFNSEDAQTGIASFLQHGPGKATFQGR
jgi:enoyl-CoA hydratase/carnithine racemase